MHANRFWSFKNFTEIDLLYWPGKFGCDGVLKNASKVDGIKKVIEVGDFTEIFNPDLPNDDLDLQLLWIDVLKEKGTIINSCDLADAWVEKCRAAEID